MRSYYQMSGEEVLQEVNGSLEPLTNEQVREHQEQYGPNELVEGKKKTILQIFLEQYKTSGHYSDHCCGGIRIYGRCGECRSYPDRDYDECNTGDSADDQGRTVTGKSEEAFRAGGEGAKRRGSCADPFRRSDSRRYCDAGSRRLYSGRRKLLECASMKVDESALTGGKPGSRKDNDDYKRRKCTTWRPGEYGLFGQFCHLWKRFISCN
mgnify:CR=1 FL=1